MAAVGSGLTPGVAVVRRASMWLNPSALEIQFVFSYQSLITRILVKYFGGGK